MFDHVQALIKEARDQAKMLMEDAEREAREKYVVTVRPFGDADKYLLAEGGGGGIHVSLPSLYLYYLSAHIYLKAFYILFLPFTLPEEQKILTTLIREIKRTIDETPPLYNPHPPKAVK